MAVEKLIVDHIDTWTTALQTRSTAGRGSSGKIELYGIKKLRELILELAVRGKLVPQDPNDEPASELLKHIAAEKAELVKQGKIKKPKPLPEISEEEKPFELPAGWEWIKISEIGHDWGQKTPDEDFTYIDVGSINKEYGIIEEPSILSAKDAPSRARKIVQKGTVIYSTVRPYLLNIAIIESAFSPEPIASTAFAIIHPYTAMNANFIYYYLRSPVFINYVESCQTGVAYPAINDKQFFSGIIAVPPSSEQARITKKIKELMSLCDQLEQHSLTSLDAHQQLVETLLTTLTDSQNADELTENWARISEHFDTLFTTEPSIEALKQTILQLAVMGKLVPQDPNDEPASELLKRIAQEKAQLVKDGKIKKQKPLPPISDEEKPFELPDGWEWCLFEDVVDIQSGITKGRNLANRKLISIPYLRVANVQRGYLDLSEVKEIDIPEEEKDKYHVIKGDLLITEGGDWDTVGRTTVWCHDWYIANQNHVFKGRIIGQDIDPYWLETYMNSPYSRDYFASASKQTTNLASINKTQLRGCPVAIPPSSEAEKIMLKLNDFNELCEKLKLQIQSAQQTQLHLADALTDAAIN
ncbi:TPA: restriction endonuclease subunit S [Salmonella enterica subsp. enterica serovar Aberdeen]|uniref:Restriction endonuclease subunit S n=2 Tax=Salmonella enterica I TaxID=59201 RepID=A0A5H7S632_SALET|nr:MULTISPECIES: restriction endonuclease subunit S [Salmonella]EAA3202390.1 restriction endonuclease subunit S [Salmonella enterica subsp. enterica serovar Aberdeen]EAA8420087.1 restriction endonuclease subunit S [Salmonella enterica subsp. enterica]EBV5385276.1 restriction endonuclease subunit S [Salmonella enterica subsp. enterica serovar Wentworth]ECO1503077.1 restriction endonuclease subunit S [Salmonella enterica subsp. enterica serovar Virchow]EDT7471823.1 restriction endonuclease subun